MSEVILILTIQTKLGPLHCAATSSAVLSVDLPPSSDLAEFIAKAGARLQGAEVQVIDPEDHQAGRELLAYLGGNAVALAMEPDLSGLRPFSKRVLTAIRSIPPGQTWTYGQTAAAAGSPKGARAAGQALHNNPVALFAPCHRIIGADGSLTGFGSGLATKQALLELERGGQSLL